MFFKLLRQFYYRNAISVPWQDVCIGAPGKVRREKVSNIVRTENSALVRKTRQLTSEFRIFSPAPAVFPPGHESCEIRKKAIKNLTGGE
ncbi:MAG: hypothetical protein VR67_00680 [Peptococcaceae bacterium BRH_c8a]|nr:MAG: hypothetical protein VR67_00680 [Peptococcaceae bacterium BRH_c8a]